MEGNSNVIVTDGFTGNIALKTAEEPLIYNMNLVAPKFKYH